MAPGGDDEIPHEQESMADEAHSLESQELLVTESASESPSELMGNDDADASGEELPVTEDPSGSGSELLSVDELLEAAVLGEGVPAEAALLEAPASSVPTFQLRLGVISEEQKAGLKKALEAQGVSTTEKTWSSPTPVVSQLSEFQAVHLLQTLRGLGVPASCSVFLPGSQPSEEDLALGDLSAVPEPEPDVLVESAPSVVLPKGEKDVMLCSPTSLPNCNVLETFGLVIAHRSIARRMFREEEVKEKLEKELRSVPNRAQAPLASSHLQQVLRDLLLELRKSSLSKGGNAVLGVKLEAFPESSSSDPLLEQLRLVAFGTAAVVEKA